MPLSHHVQNSNLWYGPPPLVRFEVKFRDLPGTCCFSARTREAETTTTSCTDFLCYAQNHPCNLQEPIVSDQSENQRPSMVCFQWEKLLVRNCCFHRSDSHINRSSPRLVAITTASWASGWPECAAPGSRGICDQSPHMFQESRWASCKFSLGLLHASQVSL